MTNLQQLFKLKTADKSEVASQANPKKESFEIFSPQGTNVATSTTQTYQQYGMLAAGACNGILAALETQLDNAVQRIKDHQAKDTTIQDAHRAKIQQKIEVCKKELEQQEELEQKSQHIIAEHERKINELDRQIAHIKANPNELDSNPMSKMGVYIGGTILLFLTLYLFVFYSSASYSAFFKNFAPEDTAISQAIFDAQALGAAWSMGVTALIFILLIPFVFLGLGFLIHKFQEKKNGKSSWSGYFKSFALITITFIFDAILAYEITEKLYELRRTGSFEDMPPYSFPMAMESVNFWVIIFSGFLVYLIWGFVFDFTMEAYQDMDRVYVKVREFEGIKRIHLSEIDKERSAINQIQAQKRSLETSLTSLQSSLKTTVFNTVKLGLELGNFFNGWLIFVSNHNQTNTQDHVNVYNAFTAKHGIGK